MALERLRATLDAGTEENGSFRAVASHLNSIARGERGPTRFVQGAFRKTLGKHPLLWQHQDGEVIGIAQFSEGPEGLMVDGKLALGTRRGAEAYELLKMGALTDVSIGFAAKKHRKEMQGEESVRVVEEAELAECSIVTAGADPNAKVRTVHSKLADASDAFEALVGELGEEAHEGKVFSSANLTKLRSALGALVELVQKVDPGHITQIGRQAACFIQKSLVYMDPKKRKAKKMADRCAALQRVEMLAAGMTVEALPLLEMPSAYPEPYTAPVEAVLHNVLDAVCRLPQETRRALTVQAAKQYLVLVGEAEDATDDQGSAADE